MLSSRMTLGVLSRMGLRMEELEIRGLRAKAAHYFLQELPPREARHRFYGLQNRWNHTHKTSKGAQIWIAPSRSQARQLRNRATRDGLGRLQRALGEELATGLEVAWGRQLVWCNDRRLMAPTQVSLLATDTERHAAFHFREGNELFTYHLNLSVIAALVGKPIDQVEPLLHSN